MIGSLGEIYFEVSSDLVKTWQTASRHGQARFARHEILGRKPVLESTGSDLEQVELTIRLDVNFGIDPRQEIDNLRYLRDAAQPMIFTVGWEVQGYYVIDELSETWRTTDNMGALISAEVHLSLLEYIVDVGGEESRGLGIRGMVDSTLHRSVYTSEGDYFDTVSAQSILSLNSITDLNAADILSLSSVAGVLNRIPGVSQLAGMTDTGLAVIGSTIASLPGCTDFATAGFNQVVNSLSGGVSGVASGFVTGVATADGITGAVASVTGSVSSVTGVVTTATKLSSGLSLIGMTPSGVASAFDTDALSTICDVGSAVAGLTDTAAKTVMSAIAGEPAHRIMQTALTDIARRL